MATGAGSSLTKMKMRSSKSSNRVGWKLERLAISMSSDLSQIVVPTSPCSRRNFVVSYHNCSLVELHMTYATILLKTGYAVSCKDVLCSRFVNKHMLHHHHQETGHCIALSFCDLSVWCFSCDSYLDAQAIWQLRPAYEIAHLLKFGQRPAFRSIESSQLSDDPQNQGSTSGS